MVNYQQNQNKQQFLIQGPYIFYCSVLLYQNIYLCKFWCYCCILLWTWKHLVFIIFHFSKKVKFGQKNLHSLLLDIWKKWILGPVTFFLFKSIYNNNSWDIDCEGLKLLLFGDVLHFYPPKNKKKIKILKKQKKSWKISPFYTCAPKTTIIWCTVPEIQRDRQNFLSFRMISCPFTPNNWENQNFEKMKKNTWTCHHFTHAYQKSEIMIWCMLPEIGPFLALLPRTTQKIKI